MRKLSILFSLISFFTFSQDNIEIDSILYPWFSPSSNYFQFYSKNSISHFYESLANASKNQVTILHLGDSHIQSEIPTNETRLLLQKKYGFGGRGLAFPYSTAKTYSSIHYSTKHTGNWSYTKSNSISTDFPLGIMGISSKTQDSTASFTVVFNSKFPNNYIQLQILCETDSSSFDLLVESDGKVTPIDVYNLQSQNGVVNVTLPSTNNTITFKCIKTSSSQSQFTIHGFQLINSEKRGVIYNSAGVGGAKFNSVLNMSLLKNQLNIIKPDLVILDFGMSDFIYNDSIKPSLENDIKNCIATIRKSSPVSSIILCSSQDIFYKNKNISVTQEYADLLKNISKETDCAFWNWFTVSGGNGALKLWLNEGLAKTDMIHLTNNGYKIKGKLFFEAFENTKKQILKTPEQQELIVNTTPKKIEIEEKIETKELTTLSNRDIAPKQTEEIKKDTLTNFQETILKQDSIQAISYTFNKEINVNDSISKINIENSIIEKVNQNTVDTIKTSIDQNVTNSTNVINTKIQDTDNLKPTNNELTNNKTNSEIEHNKNEADSINNSNNLITPKNTADVLRPTSKQTEQIVIDNNTTNENIHINKDIKIELVENYSDSTIYKLENAAKKTTSKNSTKNLKNYEIARERQYNILDHDTLAIKIDNTVQPKEIKQVKPKPTQKPRNTVYSVRNGDNLSVIAKKLRVNVDDIRKWNNLKTDNLSIGQKLIIKR
jgi:hypothetical protein